MKIQSSNPIYHIAYWIFVILVLTLVFGLKWKNSTAAFYFISMLLPIVLGTSYFFNYVLVPRFFLQQKWVRFVLYSIYTAIVSLYLEMIVLLFSFMYLGNFSFKNLGPNTSDTLLLGVILYLLVILGSFLLMARQMREKQLLIQQLLADQEKTKRAFLEVRSNRKITKIPYEEIVYIESLSDAITIHTPHDQITSKEKISHLETRLPTTFLRIHRSFIINLERVKSFSYTEVVVDEIRLNIGRSYRTFVKEALVRQT